MFLRQNLFIRGHLYQCINAGNIVYNLHGVRVDGQIDIMFGFPITPFNLEFPVLFVSVLSQWGGQVTVSLSNK